MNGNTVRRKTRKGHKDEIKFYTENRTHSSRKLDEVIKSFIGKVKQFIYMKDVEWVAIL